MKPMSESEHSIQSKIQIELSKHGCTVFRANVGKMRTPDGRFFSTGLPSGFPDLSGFRWIDGKLSILKLRMQLVNQEKIRYVFITCLHLIT
ncbi:hypothetical protein [Lactobacillus phage phiadh]|uniref:Holliday junction resolvase n=1 Tax=Lactobacillus phage phiadh TaxID=12417 RepID=UPI000009B23B|nr:Holliday junction resolvase [Lactobacillus phage phiadh]CAB52513.1 hypothetical protein [Lactobacillus phage phiadh]